jgi:glycerol uptake facilitator-like aquaporin
LRNKGFDVNGLRSKSWDEFATDEAPKVETFGLLAVISGCARSRPTVVALAVAAYIVAAYWFTASTSFANPAVTLARSMTNTFSGVRPMDARCSSSRRSLVR